MTQPVDDAPLLSITVAQLRETLNDLGFRAKLIDSSHIESASDGMVWQIEFTPCGQATTLRFVAELLVAEHPVKDVNYFNQRNHVATATCKQQCDDQSVWKIEVSMVRSLSGGVTYQHIESWIENWISALDPAVEFFFGL
jgi:hypothetical protein